MIFCLQISLAKIFRTKCYTFNQFLLTVLLEIIVKGNAFIFHSYKLK